MILALMEQVSQAGSKPDPVNGSPEQAAKGSGHQGINFTAEVIPQGMEQENYRAIG